MESIDQLAAIAKQFGSMGWLVLALLYWSREGWKSRKFNGTRNDLTRLEGRIDIRLEKIEQRLADVDRSVAMMQGKMMRDE